MTCLAQDCARAARRRWCQHHESRLKRGLDRENDLLPKCPGCGTAMREPAPACGFCLVERGIAA